MPTYIAAFSLCAWMPRSRPLFRVRRSGTWHFYFCCGWSLTGCFLAARRVPVYDATSVCCAGEFALLQMLFNASRLYSTPCLWYARGPLSCDTPFRVSLVRFLSESLPLCVPTALAFLPAQAFLCPRTNIYVRACHGSRCVRLCPLSLFTTSFAHRYCKLPVMYVLTLAERGLEHR
ncbi:hypothetical protein EXIGLDRAFT_478253 [Exidia glandulosa HHB12029]|uniref:Uncharacterized protein n=1 Tax=Exidia glandulosa HHB12029 TaxID=1314781 RepID=A0A165JTA0_EXIGL|nr:hypothetical protein EXIGLDRAFT_478253 [Exidia glandulosa HHB12029]